MAEAGGDCWTLVDDAAGAARALAGNDGRALLTIGARELDPFAALDGVRCVVRLIEPPAKPLNFDLIIGRGPFTVAAEKRLLIDRRIDVLVTKASGRAAPRAKITAPRIPGRPAIMPLPPPAHLCGLTGHSRRQVNR